MIVYPAIDIKDGKCVRLTQGKADMCSIYFESPIDAAKMWVNKGAAALHIVDLDGAFKGEQCNLDIISKIKETYGIFVQTGGGIRDRLSIEKAMERGIDRVILGTAAIQNTDLVKWACGKYGNRIAVSVDSADGRAAYNGWTGISETDSPALVGLLAGIGVSTFVYTDIKRDGMLSGPDFNGIRKINEKFDVNMIASGGISSIEDIKLLNDMGVYGAIIGKALYKGSIRLEEALEVAECS